MRADALDEIVGLDVSYHNSSEILLESLLKAEEIDADAVEAYKARKAARTAPNSDKVDYEDEEFADSQKEEDTPTNSRSGENEKTMEY